jgi:uncharacterized protein (DUF2236 family)
VELRVTHEQIVAAPPVSKLLAGSFARAARGLLPDSVRNWIEFALQMQTCPAGEVRG